MGRGHPDLVCTLARASKRGVIVNAASGADLLTLRGRLFLSQEQLMILARLAMNVEICFYLVLIQHEFLMNLIVLNLFNYGAVSLSLFEL